MASGCQTLVATSSPFSPTRTRTRVRDPRSSRGPTSGTLCLLDTLGRSMPHACLQTDACGGSARRARRTRLGVLGALLSMKSSLYYRERNLTKQTCLICTSTWYEKLPGTWYERLLNRTLLTHCCIDAVSPLTFQGHGLARVQFVSSDRALHQLQHNPHHGLLVREPANRAHSPCP